MNTLWKNMLPGLAVGVLFMAGCQSSPSRSDSVTSEIAAIRKPAPPRIMLIETPKAMLEDYSYPANATKQVYYWKDTDAEWRFKMPTRGYAHAGFKFLHSYNLLPQRDRYEVIFQIEPVMMTRYLWIGLVDGDDQPPRRMVDVPLADYVPDTRKSGKIEVRIPLRNFPNFGIPVSPEESAEREDEGPFDWQDVRELRFTHNGGRLPAREVIITNLRITR